MAESRKRILYVYRDREGRVLRVAETPRRFRVREAMDRLASGGLAPQPGYDATRKLVYNWTDGAGTDAFIL